MNRNACLALAATLFATPWSLAGPYSDEFGGIAADDPRVAGWAASVVDFTRGPQDLAVPAGDLATFGVPANATGPSDSLADFTKVVSLGDGGSITLGFDQPIADLDGPDFAVFENGFPSDGSFGPVGIFGELAHVEVSSNGSDFFRFPSVSLTPVVAQTGSFGVLDATDLYNLAGKHAGGTGTPFDLAELAGVSPLLDIDAITQVRLVDVVGSISPALGTTDSLNNLINDPYPTASGGGGFDLDAVAVLRPVPEPTTICLAMFAIGVLAPRVRA